MRTDGTRDEASMREWARNAKRDALIGALAQAEREGDYELANILRLERKVREDGER